MVKIGLIDLPISGPRTPRDNSLIINGVGISSVPSMSAMIHFRSPASVTKYGKKHFTTNALDVL